MKKRLFLIALSFMIGMLPLVSCAGEETPEEPKAEEEGFEEIREMLETASMDDMEGMDLETLTDALTEAALCEYMDPDTGLHMVYPAMFCFDDEESGSTARTGDGKAEMQITSTPDSGGLSIETMKGAVLLEHPDGEIREYENPSCVRCDEEKNGQYSVNLYVLEGDWLFRIRITCSDEMKDSITSYIEYMIHSVSSDQNEVG